MNTKDCPRGPLEPIVGRLNHEAETHPTVFEDDRRRKALFREAACVIASLTARILQVQNTMAEIGKWEMAGGVSVRQECDEAFGEGTFDALFGEPPNAALSGHRPKE